MGRIATIWSLGFVLIVLVAALFWVNSRLDGLYEEGTERVVRFSDRLAEMDSAEPEASEEPEAPEPEAEPEHEPEQPVETPAEPQPEPEDKPEERPMIIQFENIEDEPPAEKPKPRPAEPKPEPKPELPKEILHVVRVGWWVERAPADALKKELALVGVDSFPKEVVENGQKVWTLQAGRFTARSGADELYNRIIRAGFTAGRYYTRIVTE